ncbi:TPA: hypothetical protein ACOEBE_003203, partial [Stenotrophomonas maltophilia]
MSSLSIAVANDDAWMVRLLIGDSAPKVRRESLLLAARLDRVEMMQLLLIHAGSADSRGSAIDNDNALLVAAAEGAAMRTGRWLFENPQTPLRIEAEG